MERLERILGYIALGLMIVFAGLVVYASIGMGIALPTSHEHLSPFSQGEVIAKGNNRFEVRYVARMWAFDPAELVLPEKADVDLYVSALDVNHGFQVAGTNLNLMAVPGTVNAVHHRFNGIGEYLVICHEYCGLNHHKMFSKIKVVPPQEYNRLVQELARRIMTEGEKLSVQYDCASCHTSDGTESVGPTFKGMFGKREKLTNGSEIVVDETYLIESIKYPDSKIMMNYEEGSMPQASLSDEEINQLIAYIKSLR
jgi:cytochrome c oxidase subunit 2